SFIAATDAYDWFNSNVNVAYYILTGVVFGITFLASLLVHRGGFQNPARSRFLYFKFHKLWYKMLGLASLKGIAQGYIVTAPVMLIMKLVGEEGALGVIQSIAALLSALLLYLLGRVTKPEHRITIFASGLGLFVLGALFNATLFSALGVLLFVLCLLFARPLLDLAYFPIQLKVIDVLAKWEQRNEFTYIFNHELGLYVGRLLGCGMFILLAWYVSDTIALRYALLVIAIIQFTSVFVARNILHDTHQLEASTGAPQKD
ncbi:MAG: hypothetical protein KDC57_14240, partial [Saprospiraceae bacterium]|nr:hypothetical protein [Saprospiraceae bacterium]